MNAKCLLLTHFSQRYHIAPLQPINSPFCAISFATDFFKFDSNSIFEANILQEPLIALAQAWEDQDNHIVN